MNIPRFRSLLHALAAVAVLAVAAGCTGVGGPAPVAGMTLSGSPLIGKFVWRDLVTEDPAAVKPFYAALFGWEFEERTTLGAPYTIVRQDGVPIAGISRTKRKLPDQPVSQWISFLSVTNVDRAAEIVQQDGGRIVVGPLDLPRVGRGAVVIDPEGAPLGLLRSAVGDPVDTPAPAINRFLWTEHLSRQPQAVADFYARLVGLQAKKTERAGSSYWVLGNDRPRAGVMRNPTTMDRPVWLAYVQVADPAATAARAAQLGGRVLLAPRPELRNGTLAVIADPAGAVLAVQKWPM
jgi:predicted enzyme related to lactoylglutathione lyase